MSTPTPSLAPPSSGPVLRTRSTPLPKPGYVIQSPDSRLSVHRPSEIDRNGLRDLELDSSFDSQVAESDYKLVVEITNAKDFLAMLPKKKKKNVKAALKNPIAKARPRGSGASVGLPRGPAKKAKKAIGIPVRSITLFSIFHPLTPQSPI